MPGLLLAEDDADFDPAIRRALESWPDSFGLVVNPSAPALAATSLAIGTAAAW